MNVSQADSIIDLLTRLQTTQARQEQVLSFLAANVAFLAHALISIAVLILVFGIPLVILSRPRSDA